MNIYTHNTAMKSDCTNVHMIVSEATAEDLGLDAAWFAVDAEEVTDTEELTGLSYADASNWDKICVEYTTTGVRFEKWGRL